MTLTTTRGTPSGEVRLARDAFDGVIFDLDGVLTLTARVHARAWKETFDEYLRERASRRGEVLVPFDAQRDYRTFVDGRPRDEGAQTFLASRGIHPPHGTAADGPEQDTVWGLANRKRDRFLQLLQADGVEVDADAVTLVQRLGDSGLAAAVVSSSRNCRVILELAGLTGRFDVVLDGEDRVRLGLAGKPAPDTFLEAARRLQVDPRRTLVFEDALAGVEAGRRGGFGCVIGVDRQNRADALVAAGAHVTVRTLAEVTVTDQPDALRPAALLPSALERFDRVLAEMGRRRPVVFLDYDGTLTPIVSRPEDAKLSEETRQVVDALAQRVPVTIVSGRDLRDVRNLVAVRSLYCAGSHGFEIERPDGTRVDAGPGEAFLPALESAERDLRAALDGIAGAEVERKRFTIAVHYRNVADRDVGRVARVVDAVSNAHAQLRRATGKKVFELQPRIDWHKGRAVELIMRLLAASEDRDVPLYVGDDSTDEDAFLAFAGRGVTVVVTDESRLTYARYSLASPSEVRSFLRRLSASVQQGERS